MELDKEQKYAVDSKNSMVVLAGPGAGKTRVLSHKAECIRDRGQSLVCLTFTRSAAKEIRDRVPIKTITTEEILLGIPALTIHSLCNNVVGWNDSDGYDGLLARYLKQESKPKFDWVLLDECQDTNESELDVVRSLVGKNIFAVGDPYQCIFEWQGALGQGTIDVLKQDGCEEFYLHNNYRSCPDIVEYINAIYPRDLVSTNIKDLGTTAILCRTNRDIVDVSKRLGERGIPHHIRVSETYAKGKQEYDVIGPSPLKVMTIHVAKGKEFDKVILYGWLPEPGEPEEKRLFYVAASRASKEFSIAPNFSQVLRDLKGLQF